MNEEKINMALDIVNQRIAELIKEYSLYNGETVELKRFFKEDPNINSWVEIDEEEYNRRVEIEKTLNK